MGQVSRSERQHEVERVYLDVPFQEKDEVKALGARWDLDARSWYVPPGVGIERLARWLAVLPAEEDPLLAIVGLPQACWKCGEPTMAVIACRESGQLIFAHSGVLQVIASQVLVEDLEEVGAGPLRPRFSRTMECSSWSNGCLACGALLGGFPLYEDFVECVSAELELPVIAKARIPLDVLYGEPEPEP
jgi:hypothetical protein